MGLSSSIPDEKLFPVPERVRERRRTEVGDPAPRPQQGMRNHQIDDGKLLGDDPLHFEVKRNTNLSDVLKVLNLAGGAKFSIDDEKKIIVL